MPRFLLYRWLAGHRIQLDIAELPDLEAARAHAIELAEQILRSTPSIDGKVTSRIEIVDADGNELDTVISETF